ncbi:MAG: hypothetical protein ACR2IE_12825 [Candidatus Sumerlaeaceae bacterium]
MQVSEAIMSHLCRLTFYVTLLLLARSGYCHGPTSVIGTITLSTSSAMLDLRVGVGLLHQYVDPNDDSVVSPAEWGQSSETLRLLATAKITMTAEGRTIVARPLHVSVTSGAEVKFDLQFDLSAAPATVFLSAPFINQLPGAPPATLSISDANKHVLVPAQFTWFDKPLRIERKP